MAVIKSTLNPHSADFRENFSYHEGLAAQLRLRQEHVCFRRLAHVVDRQRQRGKLLVRERIEAILDPETPFLELSALAAYNLYDNEAPSAGIVTGVGRVMDQEVMVIANDPTAKAGTYFPLTVKKHLRAQQVAEENHLP